MNSLISVIYVNYNSTDLLINSVRSVEEHCSKSNFEIIIVDNCSGAEEKNKIELWLSSRRLIREKNANSGNIQYTGQSGNHEIKASESASLPVKLIYSDGNLGFGRANNLGAKHAAGRYLFFLNPDTLILNDVLTCFFDFLERSDPKVAACGAGLLKADHTPNHSYGNFPGLLLELCNVGLGLSLLLNRYYKEHIAIGSEISGKQIQKVPYIVGADIFIRTECFDGLNGFDEKFFMYYEETDLFLRLSKSGFDACILPQARIIHYEGGTTPLIKHQSFHLGKFRLLMKSKLYYYKKWMPAGLFIMLKAVIFIQITVQYIKGNMGNDFKSLLSSFTRSSKI